MGLRSLALLIEAAAGLIVTAGVVLAAVRLLRDGITAARRQVATAALAGLTALGATALVKTIALRSWSQIGFFAAVVLLRTLLKQAFAWESRRDPRLSGRSSCT